MSHAVQAAKLFGADEAPAVGSTLASEPAPEELESRALAVAFNAVYAPLGLYFDDIKGPFSEHSRRLAKGDEVRLAYTGQLDSFVGKVFDSKELPESTANEQDLLSVRVGRGQVIVGLDAALPYLHVGQTARLTIPPELAYGRKGNKVVPPNSTLCFTIQVHSVGVDTPSARLLDAASVGNATALRRVLSGSGRASNGDAPQLAADRKGATALHLAASGGHVECVVRLLEAGASVDAEQSQPAGATALMLAVKNSADPLLVRLLVHAKADPRKQSGKGNSALSLATADGGKELLAALQSDDASGMAKAAGRASDELGIGPSFLPAGWEALRSRALARARVRDNNPRCWLQLSVGDGAANGVGGVGNGVSHAANGGHAPPRVAAPRVEVELFADVVPLTAENFRALCTGERGKCQAFGGPPLHYKGNASHRIVTSQILQFGDITSGDGKGGESIYGRKFADESFDGRAGRHRSKGILSMANSGRNSNGSQFFITLDAMPHLDRKHVVFGRVVSGMEYVEAVAAAAGTPTGVPARSVVIADCGEAPVKPERGVLV